MGGVIKRYYGLERACIMKYRKWLTIFLCSALIFAVSCTTVPITGREQFSVVPASLVSSMAAQEYSSFLKDADAVTGTPEAAMVKTVGTRIAAAVERYFKAEGMADRVEDFEWEFNLVVSDEINAWAMPGGKVVVYQGILPVTQNENGLAVVMSHEIAHVLANHGGERMSHALLFQFGGVALSELMQNRPAQAQQLFMTAYGLGGQLGVLLPYSRLQEREADRLGMIFMAMAGYDPRGAVPFWERMAASKEGKGTTPEFLSTHPSDQSRIAGIKEVLPEAMEYYKGPGGIVSQAQEAQPTAKESMAVTIDDNWRYGDPIE